VPVTSELAAQGAADQPAGSGDHDLHQRPSLGAEPPTRMSR
jgi:hypothetical protein